MKEVLHKIKQSKLLLNIDILLIVSMILSIKLINKNIDIYFDDGSQHLMRAYGTYQSLIKTGTGKIISNYSKGFGYSWDLFYGPLSTYLIIVMGLLFRSFNTGFKIVLWLIMFLSGISMYKLISEVTEKKKTALLSGIIYMTSPYLFNDIYIRHALGECMAFIFIPMVFLGLYNLFKTEKRHYYLILGASGLILSHNITTVLTAIFAFFYVLINIKSIFETRIKKGLIIDIVFILLITSFFWMPLLETKAYTNYQVYEEDAMTTQEDFLSHGLPIKDLFITPKKTNLVFEIGLPVILMSAFFIAVFAKIEENKKEYVFCFICGIFSVWMATKFFPWKWLPKSFYIIQLPWRMLVFSSFFLSIIASINMSVMVKKFNMLDVFILAIVCTVYLCSLYYTIKYQEEVPRVENYPVPNVSGQNNEWLPGMGRLEYLPAKAHKNTFYIATRESGVISLEGECQIENQLKLENYLTAKISTKENQAKLELPYIYYPGYTVKLDGVNKETYETENGFLGCTIPEKESGTIEVKYVGTKIQNSTKIISIIAFLAYLVYVWKQH